MLEAIFIYLILDVAFIITSLITLHIPAWKLVKLWALEEGKIGERLSRNYIAGHTIAFILVSFVLFPLMFPLILLNNQAALNGYTKSIMQGIIDNETVS